MPRKSKLPIVVCLFCVSFLFCQTTSYQDGPDRHKRPGSRNRQDPKKFKSNQTQTNLDSINFACTKKTPDGRDANFKIVSWNVAGLRACVKKNGMDYIKREQADIVTLQEVKCPEKLLPRETILEGYHDYWCLGSQSGYAGIVMYSKIRPINVKYGLGIGDYDSAGRLITAEYEKFFLVAAYVPNSGMSLQNMTRRLEWDVGLRKYVKSLDEKKPVILCGDLNVAHQSIDLANPTRNMRTAGFTQEERDGMTALLAENFVDTFRHLYPDKTGAYTFWSYLGLARTRNVGWRLDYFIVSQRFLINVCDNVLRTEVYGSDHCPIVLYLSI